MKTKLIVPFVILAGLVATAGPVEFQQSPLLKGYRANRKVFEMSEYSGKTYLTFMQEVIKPALDSVAENGYRMVDGQTVERVYRAVDKKVQRAVDNNGGLAKVKKIADRLQGRLVTLSSLPEEIAKVDRSVDRFKLATFLGLASGGGVAIRYHENNYAYNVHYDTTEQRSGRSYGVGPTRLANDASDKAYLDDIEKYAKNGGKRNLPQFYRALLQTLLNGDPTNYAKVSDAGQTVLTDFLAVFTAEQARNLMDGSIDIHWDAALLEVTLLASFHAGQTSFKLYYREPGTESVSFTDKVHQQTPCALPDKTRRASMRDYWQFSRNIDNEENCRRSGINITKGEFRKLGEKITSYMFRYHPDLALRVRKSMDVDSQVDNLYLALSEHLINESTPRRLGFKGEEIVEAWVAFLSQVTKSADDISQGLGR